MWAESWRHFYVNERVEVGSGAGRVCAVGGYLM